MTLHKKPTYTYSKKEGPLTLGENM